MELKKSAMAEEKYVSCGTICPSNDGCECAGTAARQSAAIQSEY